MNFRLQVTQMIAADPSCRVGALLGLPAQTPGAEMPILAPKEENPGASTREPHKSTSKELI